MMMKDERFTARPDKKTASLAPMRTPNVGSSLFTSRREFTLIAPSAATNVHLDPRQSTRAGKVDKGTIGRQHYDALYGDPGRSCASCWVPLSEADGGPLCPDCMAWEQARIATRQAAQALLRRKVRP